MDVDDVVYVDCLMWKSGVYDECYRVTTISQWISELKMALK
jgi:hypothetical protein